MAADQKEWLDKSVLCWIDYETSGLDPDDALVFPIEVGFMLTDINMKPLPNGGLSALINWGFADMDEWDTEAAIGAFPYHKITPQQIARTGNTPAFVAKQFVDIIEQHRPTDGRVIMLSDNIQFEWQFTKRLLAEHPDGPQWPFHYCGWDTSILQLVPGLGFEDPADPPHRALPDVMGLHRAVDTAIHGVRKLGIDRSIQVGVA